MKAVDYLKEKARMTNCYSSRCNPVCCPLSSNNNGIGLSCALIEKRYPEKAVEIVEKWAKENPVKTYLSVLLEKFPNAPLLENGDLICPQYLFGDSADNENCLYGENCVDCWNREYKEE